MWATRHARCLKSLPLARGRTKQWRQCEETVQGEDGTAETIRRGRRSHAALQGWRRGVTAGRLSPSPLSRLSRCAALVSCGARWGILWLGCIAAGFERPCLRGTARAENNRRSPHPIDRPRLQVGDALPCNALRTGGGKERGDPQSEVGNDSAYKSAFPCFSRLVANNFFTHLHHLSICKPRWFLLI